MPADTVVICGWCHARSDDPDGHAATCKATGGWAPRQAAPPPSPDFDRLLGAATRAAQILEQHGQLGGEGDQSLLNQGIGLLRLLRDYQSRT